MSHVDEGTIHAWLDGAFGPDDPERARIEAHLETCADCRAAVEAERLLAGRAADVLGQAVPDDLRVEPFEKVIAARRGGGAGGGSAGGAARSRGSYRVPLAAAATVMLAVTATLFVREYLPSSAPEQQESAAVSLEQDSPAETPQVGQSRQDEAAVPPAAMADAIEPARNERSASDDRAGAGRASGAVTVPATAEEPPAAARAATVLPESIAGERPVRSQAETRGIARSLMRDVAAEKVAVFGNIGAGDNVSADSTNLPVNNAVLALVDSVSWVPADLDAIAARLGGSAAGLDELTPDSVHLAIVSGVPLTRFVYRLEDATLVELVQWPIGAIPELEGAADRDALVTEEAANRASELNARVSSVDRVEFMLRSVLSPDSLAALSKKIRRTP